MNMEQFSRMRDELRVTLTQNGAGPKCPWIRSFGEAYLPRTTRLTAGVPDDRRPNTSNSVAVPTYTFPLITVGTANLLAVPRVSREPAWVLSYSSCATFVASKAYSCAGPPVRTAV